MMTAERKNNTKRKRRVSKSWLHLLWCLEHSPKINMFIHVRRLCGEEKTLPVHLLLGTFLRVLIIMNNCEYTNSSVAWRALCVCNFSYLVLLQLAETLLRQYLLNPHFLWYYFVHELSLSFLSGLLIRLYHILMLFKQKKKSPLILKLYNIKEEKTPNEI